MLIKTGYPNLPHGYNFLFKLWIINEKYYKIQFNLQTCSSERSSQEEELFQTSLELCFQTEKGIQKVNQLTIFIAAADKYALTMQCNNFKAQLKAQNY